MKNKGLMILGTLGVILLFIFAPLFVLLFRAKLDSSEKSIIVKVLNFEISLLILMIIANIIPFFGGLASFVLYVINIVYGIMAFKAASENKDLIALTIYEFVK